ncbi:unnamed protein product [Adineta ricciae]|uniref:H-type lectin domain-containing protein n=1 Tax=Adineta ricciae TaxID=249248 RepID=A0A814XXH0_ADIRI|nr:unnamed protein product [Adineta ricciae]
MCCMRIRFRRNRKARYQIKSFLFLCQNLGENKSTYPDRSGYIGWVRVLSSPQPHPHPHLPSTPSETKTSLIFYVTFPQKFQQTPKVIVALETIDTSAIRFWFCSSWIDGGKCYALWI